MTRPAPPNGFVLVGVVMFVLALTILVLSLFTLSSYEAQSLTQSHARTQGSYDAESGIEMVKALIMTGPSFSLASAGAAVGSFKVISAVAKQRRSGGLWDSTGVVTGDSTVWIRVTSQNYGERKTLEARFKPNTVRDYYKRLFTVANSVEVENVEVYPPPVGIIQHPASQLRLSGPCWQFVDSPADTTWLGQTTWVGRTIEYIDPVSLPSIIDYVATHPVGYTAVPIPDPIDPNNLAELNFNLHPINGPVAYYQVPQNLLPGAPPFSYTAQKRLTIRVQGTVVWVLPAGVRFDQRVDIVKAAGPPATLIIVAGRNGGVGPTSDWAIHFKGGFTGMNGAPGSSVTVFLVTDSRTVIEYVNGNTTNPDPNTYPGGSRDLSILCRDLQLMGPATGAQTLTLEYTKSSMDIIVDNLYADPTSPLPRSPGASSSLTLIRGSWRSATP